VLSLLSLAAASDVLSLDLGLPEHSKVRSTFQIHAPTRGGATPLGEAQAPDEGDSEEANMEAEVDSLEQANQSLDAELEGDDPSEGDMESASSDSTAIDPNLERLLKCKKKVDAEEAKQLELNANFETCSAKLESVNERVKAADVKIAKMGELTTKCATEQQQAIDQEEKAVNLEEKEKQLLASAKEACDSQITAAGETNQAELDKLQSAYDAKEIEIKDKDAQLKQQLEQKQAAAVSNAEKVGETVIEAALEKKDEAVAAVEQHTEETISELSTEMEHEAAESATETQAEADAKERQLKEALEKAQNDKQEALQQATEEKEALQTTNAQLTEEVTAAEDEAKQAADARGAAIASLSKYKSWAESLLVQTSTAATSAEATVEAAVVSADIIKEGALDEDIAAARKAAGAVHDAIKAVDGDIKRK
jgi:hypothetical protein